MSGIEISERAKNFIFVHIDSIELLEVLLAFHADNGKSWTAQSLALELRSNPNSVAQRVLTLKNLGLLGERTDSSSEYIYNPSNPELDQIVNELALAYRIQRHNLFEMIFSPMKKAKDFADAFRRSSKTDGSEDG